MLKDKLVKRKVSLKSLEYDEPKPGSRGHYRLEISLRAFRPTRPRRWSGPSRPASSRVQAAVQGEQLRISGKSRDDLQEAQALLRANDQDLPLRFTNYK